jgi:CRP/FNR family transcriptional regulator, nitrogen fixation regulation protein
MVNSEMSVMIDAADETTVRRVDARIANILLRTTTNGLARAQEHVLLMSKNAKCRAATFLTDLWVRLGKAQYLEVPVSYQDVADYLGLTIETLSRSITDLERLGLISRVPSPRRLLLQNQLWPSACDELRRLAVTEGLVVSFRNRNR